MVITMKRLENLRVERERVIKALGKENKNRVKLLIILMDVDDEIEEILASLILCSTGNWSGSGNMGW